MQFILRMLFFFSLATLGQITSRAAEIEWVSDAMVQQAKQAAVIIELGNNANSCGFFVSGDGLLVTAAAMLQDQRNVIVQDSRGERFSVSAMVGIDTAKQVAVLATGRKPPAFLKLHDPPAAVGSACVAMCMSPGNAIVAMDVILLARTPPGSIPEVGDCETWTLATKPLITGALGGALISGEGKAAGMCVYWGMRAGRHPQPFAVAVTAKPLASALDSVRSGGKARPFPSPGEITRESLTLGLAFQEAAHLLALRDDAGAIVKLKEAIQQHPTDPRPLDHLAGCLMSMGRLREARDAAKLAVRLDPDHPVYQSRLAEILLELGELSEGQKLARSITAKFPNFASAWGDLEKVHMAAGQSVEAEACARRASELQPGFMGPLEHYHEVLLSTGKIEEAQQARDRLSELESLYFKLNYSSPKRK